MGAGKILCIIGGIITLATTFLLSFASDAIYYYYYIGLFQNIGDIFENADMDVIILTIVFIVVMLSGVLIILGVKSRVPSIIGGILAIVFAVYFILVGFDILDITEIGKYVGVFAYDEALVENIIPFDLPLGGGDFIEISLGTYLMLGGGVLGLIGGIMGPEGF
ncbi:MAG: hypothetical protein ACFFCE_14250 [Promethearchaeota archaeon]